MKEILNLSPVKFILRLILAGMLVAWFVNPPESIDIFVKIVYSIVAFGILINAVYILIKKQ